MGNNARSPGHTPHPVFFMFISPFLTFFRYQTGPRHVAHPAARSPTPVIPHPSRLQPRGVRQRLATRPHQHRCLRLLFLPFLNAAAASLGIRCGEYSFTFFSSFLTFFRFTCCLLPVARHSPLSLANARLPDVAPHPLAPTTVRCATTPGRLATPDAHRPSFPIPSRLQPRDRQATPHTQ
jgi:hypothetical protein